MKQKDTLKIALGVIMVVIGLACFVDGLTLITNALRINNETMYNQGALIGGVGLGITFLGPITTAWLSMTDKHASDSDKESRSEQ